MTQAQWSGSIVLAALAGLAVLAGTGGTPAAGAEPPPSPGVAVVYPVPTGAPTGEVDVLSLGVAEFPVPSLIGRELFAHMRLAAVNREDAGEWIVDARDQLLELADGRTVEPRYAVAGGAARPRLSLGKGQRGYVDLFFALDGADPSWTSLNWKIRRRGGGDAIVASTVFERLPTFEADYAHLRPSQYAGGALWMGSFWCEPRWSSPWLRPYGGYRRYRYARHPDGFDVFDGGTRLRYERQRTPVARESVGNHWREKAAAAPAVIAHPATLDDSALAGERFSWRLKVDQAVKREEGARSSTGPSRVGESWRSRGTPEESSSSHSLSDSSPSSSSDSSSSSSSDSSSSDSSSSSGSSSSSSSSSGSSVGSHWRSPR